jgi:hypothetical protein
MAGGEYQLEQIIADVIVGGGFRIAVGALLHLKLVAERIELAPAHALVPGLVDGAILRRGHEPGARIVGDARTRPLLQGRHQRVLREFLRAADVAREAGETCDQPRGLDPPQCIDGARDSRGRHDHG